MVTWDPHDDGRPPRRLFRRPEDWPEAGDWLAGAALFALLAALLLL